MRYMMLYTRDHEDDAPPSPEVMTRMGEFIQETAADGTLLATDGLLPSSFGARMDYNDGAFSVTDGPFTETKELVSGFAIVNVDSKEQAIDIARRFLDIVREGHSEIRLMPDAPAYQRAPAG